MHINNPKWMPLVILLLGTFFAALLAQHQQRENAAAAERRFIAQTSHVVEQITRQIHLYEYGLRGARGAIIGAGGADISHERFMQYGQSLDLPGEFPGTRGFGFIRRVLPAQEAAYVAAERQRVRPDFHISQWAAHAGEKDVIQSFFPENQSGPLLGWDTASDPIRRQALQDSIRTGHATLTRPIHLLDGTPGQSFLLLLPVYRAGAAYDTPAQRAEATIGWVYAALVANEVMGKLDDQGGELSVTLSSLDDHGQATPFFSLTSDASVSAHAQTKGLTYDTDIAHYGQIWHVHIQALPRLISNMGQPSLLQPVVMTLACALLLACIIYLYLLNLDRRTKVSVARARLAAIVESSSDAIIGKTLEGVVMSWNSAAENMFGYTAQEAIGHTIRELVIPADRAQEEADILAHIGQGEIVPHFETIRRRKDGSTLPVSVTVSPIRNPDGYIEGAAKTVRDISKQKAAEAQILQLNATLEQQVQERTAQIQTYSALQQAILESAGYSIIATNADRRITLFNPAAERMLGYKASEVVGLHTPLLFHDATEIATRAQGLTLEQGHPVAADLEVFTAGNGMGSPQSREWSYIRKDGSRLPVLLTSSPLRDDDGNVFGYIGIAVDLSEHKRDEAALRQAKDNAEAATRAKSDFLANMSHEIRTPINAILGMLQLLQQTRLSPQQHDYTEKAESAAKALLALLNDILDFSKVEAGKLELDPHPFMLDKLLRDIGMMLSASLGKKDIEILFDIDAAIPKKVVGDALRLQQILINLCGNAIKFTEHGEVVLGVRLQRRHEQQLTLYFTVRDTGIGISPEQIKHIFEGFSQAEVSTTRRFGGTGLGLAICQRLARLMGGQLSVDSQVGQGSTFHFAITLQTCPDEPLEASKPLAVWRGLRTLIIDDNASARDVLARMIQSLQWHTDLATSGAEALSLLEQSHSRGYAYDLIFVDWAMPQMDGWQTAARIRQLFPTDKQPVIIMITAYSQEMLAQRLASEQALLDGFLVKPITAATLFDAVADAQTRQSLVASPTHPQAASNLRLEGLKLLLVEDNLINQQVARELLCHEGAQVDVASGGGAGIAAVQAANPQYDAVLMDIQMPDMDGFTATREIRHKLGLHALPIIAMTANAMASDRQACLDAGMNEHIGKPFDLSQLVAVIRQFTLPGASHLPAPPPVQKNHNPGAVPPAALKLASELGLDLATALSRLGNDLPLFEWALNSFLTASPQTLAQLAQWWTGSPQDALARLLHTLKGTAGTVGATQLAEQARQLEVTLRTGISDTELGTQLNLLHQALQQTCADVATLVDVLQADNPPPVAEPAPHTAALAAQLQTLSGLLAGANMEALHAFAQIKEHLQAMQPEQTARIGQAIDRLDFAAARVLCEKLQQEIEGYR